MGANDNYTNSALRVGDEDPYPQRRVGEFIGTVVSNTAVNDEYKHIVLRVHEHALKAYAGQMFHLLCPSPDGAEVWMRRPMSVYRVDRAAGQIEFLYKTEGRGTRGMALLAPGDDFNVTGPLGVGFKLDPAWKNLVVLGRGVGLATLAPLSQLANENGVGVTAILSARHAGVVMSRELFDSLGARTVTVLDSDNTSAVENVETLIEDLIAAGQGRRLLHLRLEPPAEADATAGQEARHPGPGRHGADHGLRLRRLLRLHANLRSRRTTGAPAGVPRRAGVQHAGGGGMVDLSVKIGDITLQNPVTPASGAFSWEYNDVIDLNRLGGLVAKTICREPRLGNPTPRMAETEAGIIQSIGLPGKGIEYFIDHIVPEYARFTPPLIVSVSSDNVEDFAALAEELSIPDVDVIEANISCPTRNLTGQNFAMHEDYTRDCITAIRAKTKKPLWVKLSPNAGDIVSIGKAAETAGADCLVIANTFLSLKIRTDNFRPALGNKFGGLVSPALKPIVLRMVYQVAKQVKIPIIGIGGVTKAEDVVEYMLAGASAVGIGYAGFRNPTALTTIIDDLEAWCDERGIKKVSELIGAVRDDDMETDTLVAASAGV